MKTIFILMDSLNRHFLPLYGTGWARTPNLDRLAQRGVVFDSHYSGSLPCMPARRELMTGRLNFLETPWGPIEPWDDCLPALLRRERGVYSHLVTDHYHYFHAGGEGYHTLFDSWEFERGQEGDVWRPLVRPPPVPETRGKSVGRRAYWANRQAMDLEADEAYSTPRCFMRAMEFLDANHAADNWHLHLEAFDPHEPFDAPQRYRDLYGDTWDRYLYNWPAYQRLDPRLDDAAAVEHIRKAYAATLTMADAWLGRFLDRMDAYDLWRDTAVILTTDHGHMLGEHGYWAKNYQLDYEELVHIPLIVCHPGIPGGRRACALTAAEDIMPTLMELHGAPAMPPDVRGRSLLPLLERDGPHRDGVLFGAFGKDVNLVDGRYSYCRQPLPGSVTHWHTAMPRGFSDFLPREQLAAAETGVFLPTAKGIPHYRMAVPSRRHVDAPDFNPIFDLAADPGQARPVRDSALEARLAALMTRLLAEHDAPPCQYGRLGLEGP